MVGGGEAALQKLRLLCRTPADIHVVAAAPCPEIEALAGTRALRLSRRSFETRDIVGCRLAVAATLDAGELAHMAAAARAAGVPLNAVDCPELCDFVTPAIVDRDPLVVAIGTEGTAPVLARQIKARIEALLPARIGALARFAQSFRSRVATALPGGGVRRRFWERFFAGETARRFLAGDVPGAEAAIEGAVEEAAGMSGAPGRVSLVGAGPGDPDLLTFKALQALQRADVIVVDRLVDRRILEVARRDARRVEVGKTPGGPSTEQAEIDRILLREARVGRHVVRLKGGDPFVFGRGGEELAALRDAGIEVDIVPGITAALGCAAAIGLPLTERGVRRSLVLMTGQASDGPADHDWRALARPGQVLAIYMGVGAAGHIERRLLAAGIDPETPVTIVENGTLPTQKVAVGRIAGLAGLVIDHAVKGPAIIYVGAAPEPRPEAEPRPDSPVSKAGSLLERAA